ncbi:MAG: hypothetical protein BZY82_02710 [SAR202 cluster bacterium Io17-Chloro-G3]|nr:MAG: hypothetical protein BZY82_02710 [SAR202 cluster bacterium Io17-Chloro-G3]
MIEFGKRRLIMVGGLTALILGLGACSTAVEPTPVPAPIPTAQAPMQPAPAYQPASVAKALPAATALPFTAFEAPRAKTGDAQYGGHATFAHRRNVSGGFDPTRSGSISLYWPAGSIMGDSGLVIADQSDSFAVVPGIAESWEASADFTKWTFTIRDNAVWHDGTKLTAEDVKWWVEFAVFGVEGRPKWSAGIAALGMGATLSTVEVVSGNKVQMTFKEPQPHYLRTLIADRSTFMMAHPRHLVQPEFDSGNVMVAPPAFDYVALGPFKMKRYVKGSVIQVSRFDQWWGVDSQGRQLPYLDSIDYPIIPDQSAIIAGFRTGRLDSTARGLGYAVTPEQEATIKRDLGDKAYIIKMPGNIAQINMNTLFAPWDDIRVRKALSLWFDRQQGIQAVFGGNAVMSSIMTPQGPWSDPSFVTWPGYNPDTKAADRAEAKKLLTEAGFPDGFALDLVCASNASVRCEYFEGQLSSLGLKVNVNLVTSDARTERVEGDNWDVTSGGAEALFPLGIATQYDSKLRGETRHLDTNVDAYFPKIAATADFGELQKLVWEMESYIVKEQYLAIPLFVEVFPQAYRSHVHYDTPSGSLYYGTSQQQTWLDQ